MYLDTRPKPAPLRYKAGYKAQAAQVKPMGYPVVNKSADTGIKQKYLEGRSCGRVAGFIGFYCITKVPEHIYTSFRGSMNDKKPLMA
jgi:hypothetical protein